MANRRPSLVKRILKSAFRVIVAVALAIVFLLLLFQSKLIYHPRPYEAGAKERNPAIIPLSYKTSQGPQQAFYLPPRALPLRHLWVLFPGNASLALDWLGFIDPPPDTGDGFLLVDYPGYGDCHGNPSPAAIQESAEAAFACLAGTLHMQPANFEGKLNVLAISLGCATGLNFAVRHPVERIILVAPFTSMHDMARCVVGWPLCWLLLHHFDNRARLGELAARAYPPQVTIFHGDEDDIVPFAMGHELAGLYPAMITFHEVPGAGHNTVLFAAKDQIFALMR